MLRILAFILGVIFVVLGFTNKVFWIAPLSGLLFYLFGFALKLYPRLKRLGVFIYIPVLLLVKDISQAFGYTLGLLERLIKPKYRRIAKEKFLLKK